MTRDDVERLLAEAVEADRLLGSYWWPGEQIAPIAYRRWTSFERRPRARNATVLDRTRDLAKGLQAHFEPDIPYTPFSDWMTLAEMLARVFAQVEL